MENPDRHIRRTTEGVEVRLRVQPRAKRCEFAGLRDGMLKLKVTAPPVDDAANRAVIEFLAKRLGVAKSRVRILSGAKGRDKVLQVNGISPEQFRDRVPV